MRLLSLFLGRLIVDEVLPPSFLAAALSALRDGSLGVAVVQQTGAQHVDNMCAQKTPRLWLQ